MADAHRDLLCAAILGAGVMSDDKVLHWSFETKMTFLVRDPFYEGVTVDTIKVFVISHGEKFEIVDVVRLPNPDSSRPKMPEELSKSDLLVVVQNENIKNMASGALGVQKFFAELL